MKNWKTTVMALIPLVGYALKFAGVWPAGIPLPPFEEVWPALFALVGVGLAAKDNDVTGGTR